MNEVIEAGFFSLRKGAPFLDLLSQRMQWLFQMGIIDFWKKEVSAAFIHKKMNSLKYNVSEVSVLSGLALIFS